MIRLIDSIETIETIDSFASGFAKPVQQIGFITAAQGDFDAGQFEGFGSDFADAAPGYDIGAVYPEKLIGGQLFLDIF